MALLTPIVKALSPTSASTAPISRVQIYGGHGYIRDNGMEQFVRDARITQIYEGTNGIQALDLVGRKLRQAQAACCAASSIRSPAFIEEAGDEPAMAEFVLPLAKAFARLQQATAQIAQAGLRNPEEAGAAATDYLNLFALTCACLSCGRAWRRSRWRSRATTRRASTRRS